MELSDGAVPSWWGLVVGTCLAWGVIYLQRTFLIPDGKIGLWSVGKLTDYFKVSPCPSRGEFPVILDAVQKGSLECYGKVMLNKIRWNASLAGTYAINLKNIKELELLYSKNAELKKIEAYIAYVLKDTLGIMHDGDQPPLPRYISVELKPVTLRQILPKSSAKVYEVTDPRNPTWVEG